MSTKSEPARVRYSLAFDVAEVLTHPDVQRGLVGGLLPLELVAKRLWLCSASATVASGMRRSSSIIAVAESSPLERAAEQVGHVSLSLLGEVGLHLLDRRCR